MLYKKTKLKNGLRIITAPIKGTETATVVVMVGVGSRFETEKQAGLSHFIEHMFFKGTEKRPTTLDISAELDAVGGEYNAFTGKDQTGYYAKVDARHIDTALDVVADMFLNSKIEQAEIDKEKGTIIQELNMYEDMPMRNIGDVFENTLYPNHPLGREIVGYKKTIHSFKRKDFMDYIKRFYLANDTVIAVAGKINEKEIVKKLEKYFSKMNLGKKPDFKKVKESQKKPEVRIKFKKTDQTHLMIGARAYDENNKDRYTLSVMSVILGGNMSSRLFIEVREKRGLAYYVRTSTDSFKECGYIASAAGVEHKNLELATKTIWEEYKKITSEKVSEEELNRAKEYIKGKTVMNMEASDEVAMFAIDQEVKRGKILTPEEKFRLIDKVNADDILRVARDVFQKKKMNLVVIGPHKDEEKLRGILNG